MKRTASLIFAYLVLVSKIGMSQAATLETLVPEEVSLLNEIKLKIRENLAFKEQIENPLNFKNQCINPKTCVYLQTSYPEFEKSFKPFIIDINDYVDIDEVIISYKLVELTVGGPNKSENEDEESTEQEREFSNRGLKIDNLIFIATSRQFLLLNFESSKLLAAKKLDFEIDLACLEYLQDDKTIAILSKTKEVYRIQINISLNLGDNEYKMALPLIKKVNTDLEQIIQLKQHKLHSNKYYVLASQSGTIYILNKDLELRTSFNYSYPINDILLNQGFIGIISDSEIFFTNILGGNSILLKCYSTSQIIHFYYDAASHFMFILNAAGHLEVFSTKLSMSKQNTNECNGKSITKKIVIYNYEFKSFARNETSLVMHRKSLFIQVSSKDIYILDTNHILNSGEFILNQIVLMKTYKSFIHPTKSFVSGELYIKQVRPQQNPSGSFLLVASQPSHRNIIVVKQTDITGNNASLPQTEVGSTPPTESAKSYQKPRKSESSSTSTFNYHFVINILVIISISVLVYYFKNRNNSGGKTYKKFEEDILNDKEVQKELQKMAKTKKTN